MDRALRSRRASTRVVAAVVAVACVAGSAVAAVRVGRVDDEASIAQPVRATGHVRGMYPGRVRTMKVRVTNPGARDVRLVSVRVRVRPPSSACPASSVVVRPFRGSVRLRAGSSVRIEMRVRMRRSAGDACQGARFPLRFRIRTEPA